MLDHCPDFFEKLELELEKLAQRQHIEKNADIEIFQNQGHETLYNCVYIPPSLLNNDTSESLRNDYDTQPIVFCDFNINFLLNSTNRIKIEDFMIGNGL